MSSTMQSAPVTSNADHFRLSESVAPVQVVGTLNGTLLHGFVVLDAKGEFIAWADNISTAKGRCDGDPLARTVERCADGACMSWKAGKSWARKL